MSKILERHPALITEIRKKRRIIKAGVRDVNETSELAKADLLKAFTIIDVDSADDTFSDGE
jgi:hypothetical protein